MTSALDLLRDDERSLLRARGFPRWIDPMKATLSKEVFSDPAWVYEPKLDGERCLVFRGREPRLMSRNQKSIGHSYPEIVEAIDAQAAGPFVVDGEIVALAGKVPSFGRLQRRMHVLRPSDALVREVPVLFHAFDIVYLDGFDLTRLPLVARKRVLKTALSFRAPLRFVAHRKKEGERYFDEICGRPGWEGLIAKRGDSRYVSTRSRDWLKLKCANEQEFVIGGFTDPQGSRTGFGALLVGYYEDGELRYAGKVGTGYKAKTLTELKAELDRLERATPPFADRRISRRAAHWVQPKLIAQIAFGEWTGDGRLRHPRFLGLRRDKDPKEVVRERPQ